jgi:inosine-uridine nucleoside N-ribohydrolase
VTASAVDLILESAEGMTVIALGPLTNVGAAARKYPQRFRKLARVVVMGGAFRTHGNVTAAAEFNIHADPDAANAVLASGVPLTFVPLDVTMQAPLRSSEFPRRDGFVRSICESMSGFYRGRGVDGFYPHDALAVAVAVHPEIVQTKALAVEVETAGLLTRGMTVADMRPWCDKVPNADVALGVNAERFSDLFRERVLSYA